MAAVVVAVQRPAAEQLLGQLEAKKLNWAHKAHKAPVLRVIPAAHRSENTDSTAGRERIVVVVVVVVVARGRQTIP